MKVRFCRSSDIYDLAVTVLSSGLVQLHPPLPDVDLTAGFEILTEKGAVFGRYPGHTTVFQKLDDGGIILSADGSVYTPPEPAPEPEPPTLTEVKAQKKKAISAACERAICLGVNVALPSGWEHFSLTQNDQINLFGKQAQLAAGAESLEYHADGCPCRYFTAAEMQKIITAAMEHVSYHTTYCNSLNMWIAGAESIEEVNKIYYGADIPEEYQSQVLKDYLVKIMTEAAEVADEAVS